MARVYAVGVGPGSPRYVTGIVADLIDCCDVIVGYRYTLDTIRHLIADKEVHEVTMRNQEEIYRRLQAEGDGRKILVPFTGDACFSESEVVDRLVELFEDVEVVPGISSIQVAAARAAVALDKARVITMHVTSSIEGKKRELRDAVASGLAVILIPRPWPGRPDKHFMPSEVAHYLEACGFNTEDLAVKIYEKLTTREEKVFEGTVAGLKGMVFSDMCVMVLNRVGLDSYINYRWQWE